MRQEFEKCGVFAGHGKSELHTPGGGSALS
jgi:hypothetical protein